MLIVLFHQKEAISLTIKKIIVFVEANIGREDRKNGEEFVRGAVDSIAKTVLPMNKTGETSDTSLILEIIKTPFKDTKVYVHTYVKTEGGQKEEMEKIRKAFSEIPWCVKSQISEISEKNWITLFPA